MYKYTNDTLLELFLFETSQMLEQLESLVLNSEKSGCCQQDSIHEIFRFMHTIKGSSAMMGFNGISSLAHSVEDLFYFLREKKPDITDYSDIFDLVLQGVDFIKLEIVKIRNSDEADGNPDVLIERIKGYLSGLSDPPDMNRLKAVLYFEEGCEMENIRAWSVIHRLKDLAEVIRFMPEDIGENDCSSEVIKRSGFTVFFNTQCCCNEIQVFLMQTLFIKNLELYELKESEEQSFVNKEEGTPADDELDIVPAAGEQKLEDKVNHKNSQAVSQQSMVSVSVSKLDKLMDLVGEMVIAEAMVVQNPDLKGLTLENFNKSARQLNKITSEIRDMVMSIRMVSLSATFHKMYRILRDMCRKLGKEASLVVVGEETEVDKNIIEHISDPLMHLVRNALDHGIETLDKRRENGKPDGGTITLEARNAGSDVLIMIKDDGQGLDKEKILSKARINGLIHRPESEMTDKEIFNLIFLPGFSTNDSVTEFSGRGVGMDVVSKNIEAIGGSVSVESYDGKGTSITLKIPLTLAIIDGMNIKVGNSRYTLPTISIKESFRPRDDEILADPDNNEMIMVRGQCYPILRLHEFFKVRTNVISFSKGIIIMLEENERSLCVFADELLGQQQVVVKALPEYIGRFDKIRGLAGCTLLGDGSISLILDVAGLMGLTGIQN